MTEICHCGQPIHYTDKDVESHIKALVKKLGRYVTVTSHHDGTSYKVDRHYIALHGLMGKDLHTSGFEVIND